MFHTTNLKVSCSYVVVTIKIHGKIIILLLHYDSEITFTSSWTPIEYISFCFKPFVQNSTFSESQRCYFRRVAFYSFVNDCHR